jgi:prepilin-type N-terminal cleavage/methylation domain-containing protein
MRRAGFTLLELLVVIAIILALAVAIVPNIGAGFSGTQISTASRSLMQAARYARTMAILHQIETELVLVSAAEGARYGASSDGKPDPRGARIEVRVAEETMRQARVEEVSRGDGAEDESGDNGDDGGPSSGSVAFGDGAENDADDVAISSGVASTGAALGDLAAEVHASFPCGTVVFEFLRFTDEDELEDPDSEVVRRSQLAATGGRDNDKTSFAAFGEEDGDGEGDDTASRTISFLFDSDGTCRPFDIALKDSPDSDTAALSVSIDRWGRGKIEGRDDD